MTSTNLYTYAFLDADDKVVATSIFSSHDLDLINQTKINFGAESFKSCEQYGECGIGSYFYNDAFYPPKPYASWIIDENSKKWIAPVPYPDNDNNYYWKEESYSWILIPQPPDDEYPYVWNDEQKEWDRVTTYWDSELSSWENIPEKPNESSIWNFETKSWVLL